MSKIVLLLITILFPHFSFSQSLKEFFPYKSSHESLSLNYYSVRWADNALTLNFNNKNLHTIEGIKHIKIQNRSLNNFNTLILKLNNNNLKKAACELGTLRNLNHIDLSYNKLNTIPLELCLITNLSKLYLMHNAITDLPSNFNKLTNLTSLNISYNKLQAIPFTIDALINLCWLCMSNNQIEITTDNINNLKKLAYLDLSYNRCTSFSNPLTNLTNLSSLNLAHNQITTISPKISNLNKLLTLNLSHNNITSLPLETKNLCYLCSLNLANNPLTNMPHSLYNTSAHINLQDTPLGAFFNRYKKEVPNFNAKILKPLFITHFYQSNKEDKAIKTDNYQPISIFKIKKDHQKSEQADTYKINYKIIKNIYSFI